MFLSTQEKQIKITTKKLIEQLKIQRDEIHQQLVMEDILGHSTQEFYVRINAIDDKLHSLATEAYFE